MNAHLTEGQLDRLMNLEPMDGSVEQHLAACTQCRSEADLLHNSLLSFRQAADAYAAHHAPIRPRAKAAGHSRFFTLSRSIWAAGLVAAMALCTASISLLHRPDTAATPPAQTAEGSRQPTQAESDDALLQNIDTDLSTSIPPSLQPLDVTATSETSTNSTQN